MYSLYFFFFNDTATTEIYTLSLHDALPIFQVLPGRGRRRHQGAEGAGRPVRAGAVLPHGGHHGGERARVARPRAGALRRRQDRKSTRLNSSHANISYAVFCLKKKKTNKNI